jgi:hypothetical protein
VQRVDLWPALTLLLMAHTQREIEQWTKAVFERCIPPSDWWACV